MDIIDENQLLSNKDTGYLDDEINLLQESLSYALKLPQDEIKISFPSLSNFYYVNNVYKSSWAIYVMKDEQPLLLFSGNFFIQGGNYSKRSIKSPFGATALSSLTSIANTFSKEASYFKQNWGLDLDIFEEDDNKLKFSVAEYKSFLKLLNKIRALWLLHLSEEGKFDFVISEFSEPSDSLFFVDLENIDSLATKIKTYFKPISQKALQLIQKLSSGTEFEGKFFNLQPGTWLRDDVLLELEKYYPDRFFGEDDILVFTPESEESSISNPFKVQALRSSY